MKLYISTLLIFISAPFTFAQHNFELYADSVVFFVANGAEVHVNGDVHFEGTSIIRNNGLIRTQGNTYGGNEMQQRGSGTYRIENNSVNTGEWQSLNGSLAVRGGQSQIGFDDGSFYDLELANDIGVVQVSDGVSADVRNSVDFNAGSVRNRIVTATNLGTAALPVYPANGSLYTGVFGMMNPASGNGSLSNSSIDVGGNSSSVDAGYIQGRFRRAIDNAGGNYGFLVGLEPAGAGAQRGFQYLRFDAGANSYDVIESYFQAGLDNSFIPQMECSGYFMDYFGGLDHGQWVLDDITNAGMGNYDVSVWPQDHNMPFQTVWAISKDNSIQGTADECGPTSVGLSRSAFSGFNISGSQFGLIGSNAIFLPLELVGISANGNVDHINVSWQVLSESDLSHYELERSENGNDFVYIGTIDSQGNPIDQQAYDFDDYNVRSGQDYYYHLKMVDFSGTLSYSPTVVARIDQSYSTFDSGSIDVFPNPSLGDFILSVNSESNRFLEVKIYNSIGQIQEDFSATVSTGNTIHKIETNNWAPGVYNLKLVDANSQETIIKRIIKQ